MKHAFLITAHAYLPLVESIVQLLLSPNHYFFINIDRKAQGGMDFMMHCKQNYSHVFFLEGDYRMEVAHGGYTQVECLMRLLKYATEYNMDYFHFISGQDYPCKSNQEFDLFFEQNRGYSYMQMDSDTYREECMKKKYPKRVKPYYFKDTPHRKSPVIDFVVRGVDKLSSLFLWRKDIPNLWGGWNWFSWYKDVVKYVLKQERENPQFFKRFHHTYCCDELIFATMLRPFADELNIETDNSLRYINWDKKVSGRSHSGSPLILNEEEYEDIICSGAFFCRKIHPVISKKLLDKLKIKINGNYNIDR